MGSGNSLLQIIEQNVEHLQDAIARRFRNSGRAVFDDFEFEDLRTFAWSHIDPILQSLRYEDQYLFSFFLDYSSGRNAEKGLPMEDNLFTLGLVSETIWECVVDESHADDLAENLGQLVGIVGKGKDGIAANYMTQRDELLGELRESNAKLMEDTKRKLDFLAKVSHELKTPLTSVIAYSEQLMDSGLPSEIRVEFSKVVHDQSSKLLQLIEDLMELSKFQNDRSRLNLSWADPATVIEEAIGTVQVRARQKEITIETGAMQDLPKTHMDPFRVQQVIWNLLTNGVKYNEPGGTVTVDAKRQGDELMIAVSDDGIGIKPENQEMIFQSFHQTEDALAMLEGGAGLGLDIVRHYLNLHGGRIAVESVYGEGSTFTVYLPIAGPNGAVPDRCEEEGDLVARKQDVEAVELQKEPH